jgi:heterodisulfide reductase subunit A-like polyferredoxin
MTPRTLPVEERLAGFKEVNLLADKTSAQKEAARCLDCGGCCECMQCTVACKAEAVTLATHAQEDEWVSLATGAVILAGGFEVFDAKRKGEYGYGRWPNVITSLEYERILSAAGPFQGHIQRISDGKSPRRIAWIQCVGSREPDNMYCSRICCTAAIKNSLKLKSIHPDAQISVLYRDIRTFGLKEAYYLKARQQGVRFYRF